MSSVVESAALAGPGAAAAVETSPTVEALDKFEYLPSVGSWLLPLPFGSNSQLRDSQPSDASLGAALVVQPEAKDMTQRLLGAAAELVEDEEEELERSALLDEEEAGEACEDFVVYEVGSLTLLPPVLRYEEEAMEEATKPADASSTCSEGSSPSSAWSRGSPGSSCFTPRSGWSTPRRLQDFQEVVSSSVQLVAETAQQGIGLLTETFEASDVAGRTVRCKQKTEAFVAAKSEVVKKTMKDHKDRMAKGVRYVRSKSRERIAAARKRSEPLQRRIEAAWSTSLVAARERSELLSEKMQRGMDFTAERTSKGLDVAREQSELFSEKMQKGIDFTAEQVEAVRVQVAEKAQRGFEYAAERTGTVKEAAGNIMPSPRRYRAASRSGA